MLAQQTYDYGQSPEKGSVSPGERIVPEAKIYQFPIQAGLGEAALGSEIALRHGPGSISRVGQAMSVVPYSPEYGKRARELRNR